MHFTATTLGTVTENFDRWRRPVKASDRGNGPYPYYGASGVIDRVDGFTHDGKFLLIAEDGENLRSRKTPIAFMASGRLWVNNHAHVVRGNHLADTRYLSYLLSVTDISGYLTGSTLPKLSRAAMDSIVLQVPQLPEQCAVADVLGALDDKIAANLKLAGKATRLVQLLFTMAVDDAVTLSATFGEISTVGGGGTPRTSVDEYWSGDVPWATPTDVTALSGPYLERTTRSISDAGLVSCASPLYPAGSILMTSRATIGAFAVAQQPMAVNQGLIVVQPHDEQLKWWIFHEMQSRVDEFIAHANGATFLELSRGTFKQFPVHLTDDATMRKFNDDAAALHALARSALRENITLAALRDTLLPELMSGRLRVKDAEQQVGEVV